MLDCINALKVVIYARVQTCTIKKATLCQLCAQTLSRKMLGIFITRSLSVHNLTISDWDQLSQQICMLYRNFDHQFKLFSGINSDGLWHTKHIL